MSNEKNTHTEVTQRPVERPVKRLSKDTNAALRDVMATVKKLGDLVEEETEALVKTDNETFLKLQDRKLAIAQDYQNVISQMVARKNEIQNADPATKQKLKEMQNEFAEISSRNLEALGRMQRSTERLGTTIRNAAIKEAQKDRGYSYGEDGAISTVSRRKAVSSGLSETA